MRLLKKKIMIVDDEEDIRQSAKMILEKEGYKTILAMNGDDCLKKIKTKKPNLILLDIMMPGTPAKEVIKKIKNIPVIYFSVVRLSEAEKEGLLGNRIIVDFIQKPFEIKELIDKVKKHL